LNQEGFPIGGELLSHTQKNGHSNISSILKNFNMFLINKNKEKKDEN